jgi:hypothetical protein
MAKVGADDLDKSTTLESNKSVILNFEVRTSFQFPITIHERQDHWAAWGATHLTSQNFRGAPKFPVFRG